VRVDEDAGSLMVWETVPRNNFSVFFCPLEIMVFFLHSLIADGFMHLSKKEMKLETNAIAILAQLSSVALKWRMTSPSYINRLLVYSLLISRLVFVRSRSLRH
jgi:hypothetical protein